MGVILFCLIPPSLPSPTKGEGVLKRLLKLRGFEEGERTFSCSIEMFNKAVENIERGLNADRKRWTRKSDVE